MPPDQLTIEIWLAQVPLHFCWGIKFLWPSLWCSEHHFHAYEMSLLDAQSSQQQDSRTGYPTFPS